MNKETKKKTKFSQLRERSGAERSVEEKAKLSPTAQTKLSSSLLPSGVHLSGEVKKTKIRMIGIGGGGGTIVSEIADSKVLKTKKASFVIANTDLQALKISSRKAIRFQFGQSFTQGLGTGMNVELAMEAAQNEEGKIKKLLKNQDLCILVVSLGGGVGSGAASVFAKISKDLGNLTYGIFTLPFEFEGKKKMEIARTALEKLKKEVDIFSIIPNERIFQVIDKKTPLKEALSAINKNLANSLGGLIETIYEPGLINIDFADLRTIFQGSGKLAYLNTVEVQRKDDSVQKVIEKTINNLLYPYSIQGANRVLFNIAGEKELQLAEVSQLLTTVSGRINKEAKIIFGISQNKKYNGLIKVSLLAVGCSQKIFSNQLDQPDQFDQVEVKLSKKRLKKKKIVKSLKVVSLVKEQEEKKLKQKTNDEKKQKPPALEKEKEIIESTEQIEPKEKGNSKKIKIKIFKKDSELKVNFNDGKVRKNALQVKKEAEEVEKEMLEKEKFWEVPAFLRKKFEK